MLCHSRDALDRAGSECGGAARELLSLVAAASSLDDLRRFRSVEITSASVGDPNVEIRMGRVCLVAQLLPIRALDPGRVGATPQLAMKIHDLLADGRRYLRAAS